MIAETSCAAVDLAFSGVPNFAWEEEFHLLWDIEAWFRSIQVKYQSLEEMLEAEEEETEPEESAFDAWHSDGGDLDLSWGRPTSPGVTVTSLQPR